LVRFRLTITKWASENASDNKVRAASASYPTSPSRLICSPLVTLRPPSDALDDVRFAI